MASVQIHPVGAAPEAEPLESVPWHNSLRTRLVLLTTLCCALLMLGVGLLVYAGARRALVEQSRREIRDLAEQTALGLEATMGSLAVSAATLAASVRGIGADPADLRALLRATTIGDPDIAGTMLILEPGALHAEDAAFSWYVRAEREGFHEQPMLYDGYDYHEQAWWARTLRDAQPWWSEPYRNEATGDVLFVTYNHAIRAGESGSAVGMVSVDVPVQRLRDLIGKGDGPQMYKVLLSPAHRFVLHPDPAVENRVTFEEAAADARLAGLRPLLEPLSEGRAAESEYNDPASGAPWLAVLQPAGDTGWTVGVVVSDEYVVRHLRQATRNVVLFGILSTLLALLGLRLVAHRVTRPIVALTASASHFVAGEFDRTLPHTQRTDEVGVMARAFDHARGSIKAQMRDIEQMSAARQKLESELSIARDIQTAMLPRAPTLAAGRYRLATHAILEPAKAVGGDFYTFLARDDHTLLFAIGDVSDKGVPAALFMARTITTLEVAAGMGGSPADALRVAARRLVEGNDTCMFATVLCGVVDAASGEVAIASAGHDPPLLRHADGRVEILAVESAEPLGFAVAADYPAWRGRLAPGDALVAYTDGITEALDANDAAFGIGRVLDEVAASGDARALCESLVAAAHHFAGGAPQSDDITVVALSFDEVEA